MSKEELEREISRLEVQIDHMTDEKRGLEEKIAWFDNIVRMDLQLLEDMENDN